VDVGGASPADLADCYQWGLIFASPWDDIVKEMSRRAANNGLTQEASERILTWMREGHPAVRYIFVDDPSDFDAIRRIYTDDTNARIPLAFVIVKQPDESETRGETVFDIFRLSPKSYLWHFFRVFTPPESP
jgi:hypothetical protein